MERGIGQISHNGLITSHIYMRSHVAGKPASLSRKEKNKRSQVDQEAIGRRLTGSLKQLLLKALLNDDHVAPYYYSSLLIYAQES